MALPTTNLTLHCDASDTDKVFTTYDSGGNHSGVPANGNAVQVWDDEGDGIADVSLGTSAALGYNTPDFRSGGSALMAASCIDFNGSDDAFTTWNQVQDTVKSLANFIDQAAYMVFVAIYADAITTTDAFIFNNHCVIGDSLGYFGIFLRDDSGTRKAYLFNYDGSSDDTGGTACTAGASHVLMGYHTGGNIVFSVDGGTESTPVASGNTAVLTGGLQVGKGWITGTSSWYNGRVGELAVYNAYNATDKATALSYFTSKWLGTGGLKGPLTNGGPLAGGSLIRGGRLAGIEREPVRRDGHLLRLKRYDRPLIKPVRFQRKITRLAA